MLKKREKVILNKKNTVWLSEERLATVILISVWYLPLSCLGTETRGEKAAVWLCPVRRKQERVAGFDKGLLGRTHPKKGDREGWSSASGKRSQHGEEWVEGPGPTREHGGRQDEASLPGEMTKSCNATGT